MDAEYKNYRITAKLELTVDNFTSDESREEVEDEFKENLWYVVSNVFGGLRGSKGPVVEEFEITVDEE